MATPTPLSVTSADDAIASGWDLSKGQSVGTIVLDGVSYNVIIIKFQDSGDQIDISSDTLTNTEKEALTECVRSISNSAIRHLKQTHADVTIREITSSHVFYKTKAAPTIQSLSIDHATLTCDKSESKAIVTSLRKLKDAGTDLLSADIDENTEMTLDKIMDLFNRIILPTRSPHVAPHDDDTGSFVNPLEELPEATATLRTPAAAPARTLATPILPAAAPLPLPRRVPPANIGSSSVAMAPRPPAPTIPPRPAPALASRGAPPAAARAPLSIRIPRNPSDEEEAVASMATTSPPLVAAPRAPAQPAARLPHTVTTSSPPLRPTTTGDETTTPTPPIVAPATASHSSATLPGRPAQPVLAPSISRTSSTPARDTSIPAADTRRNPLLPTTTTSAARAHATTSHPSDAPSGRVAPAALAPKTSHTSSTPVHDAAAPAATTSSSSLKPAATRAAPPPQAKPRTPVFSRPGSKQVYNTLLERFRSIQVGS